MNKKLQSLILSGVLAVSMISKPIFATNNGEQGTTVTTDIAEVPKEESLSEEEVPGDDEPSDDEIPEADASEEDETDDSETTPTESETPTDETVPPDTTEPVEKVEEAVQYIGKLDISNIFEKIDTNNNYLGEFAISSIDGITIKYANGSSYTLSAEELTYTNLNSWITINLEKHSIELGSDTCIIIEYTDDEGNLYKTEVPTSQLQSIEIYNEEKGYHLVASEMLLATVEAEKENVDEPAEDEEHQTEGEADDKRPALYSDYVPKDMPRLGIHNAYKGEFWVNEDYASVGKGGTYPTGVGINQGQYVDHIDVRIGNASIKINYLKDGVVQKSEVKNATVTHVSDILINDRPYSYVYAGGKIREDGTVHEDEFNFQIVDHPGKGKDKEIYDYSKWLDLKGVNKITIIATLTADGKSYENVPIVIQNLSNIVTTSECTNASGLDYRLQGEVFSNIIVEMPFVPEEIDINLTPGTGDISVYGNLYYPVFALAILVATNKKNNKN